MVGGVQRGVAEQRPDRGQPGVAGAHAVAPLGLQVVQERHDQGGVQVGEVQLDGLLAGAVRGERPAAAGCRGRRRRCAGWPGAAGPAGR